MANSRDQGITRTNSAVVIYIKQAWASCHPKKLTLTDVKSWGEIVAAGREYADTLFFLFSLATAQAAFVFSVLLPDAGVAFASNTAQLLSCAVLCFLRVGCVGCCIWSMTSGHWAGVWRAQSCCFIDRWGDERYSILSEAGVTGERAFCPDRIWLQIRGCQSASEN